MWTAAEIGAGTFVPSMPRLGTSLEMPAGSHQAERPKIAIAAGTSVMRMTNASIRTPRARLNPKDLVVGSGARMNAANTAIMMIPAEVTTLARSR